MTRRAKTALLMLALTVVALTVGPVLAAIVNALA